MTYTHFRAYSVLSWILVAVVLFPGTLFAQEAVPTETLPPWYSSEKIPGDAEVAIGDFVVGPGKVELEIAPGESKTVMLSVTNRIGSERIFRLEVEDAVGSADASKTVDLLGTTRGPYSLKDYVRLPGTELVLAHNERARIPVTITLPADAEPGGLYGSVLVNTVAVERNDGREQNIAPQSPVVARVGTLFFVTVPGAVDRAGQLKELSVIPQKAWYEKGPFTFGLLYENTGSVHLAPYGTLRVSNILGEEVGYVELDPWFALPQSLRFREVVWEKEFLFGRYTVTADINRGYDNIVDTQTISFWVLPWKMVLPALIVLAVIVWLGKVFFRTFEFRRKQ